MIYSIAKNKLESTLKGLVCTETEREVTPPETLS